MPSQLLLTQHSVALAASKLVQCSPFHRSSHRTLPRGVGLKPILRCVWRELEWSRIIRTFRRNHFQSFILAILMWSSQRSKPGPEQKPFDASRRSGLVGSSACQICAEFEKRAKSVDWRVLNVWPGMPPHDTVGCDALASG